jgi:tetratricopeptide (TPR) repeat protein
VRALLFLLVSCSGAPLPSDFKSAEQREAARDDAGALQAYRAIREECERTGRRRALDDCSTAAVREAEMLERLERWPEAYRAWLAAPRLSVPQAGSTGKELAERKQARAWGRAAELAHFHLHDDDAALQLAWRVVVEFPDEVPADDALKLAIDIERRKNPLALQQKLTELWERDKKLDLGDNLLFARAQLAESVDLYDQLADTYPHSGLRDDSLWRAAEILRRQGDFRGAVLRLQKILDTHRDALITGSYNSLLLDDAQLLVGRIWLDDLHQPKPAALAFQNLADDFKDSVLRDDALYDLARAHTALDDKRAACAALQRLFKEYPNGNMVRRGRELASTIGCP